MVQYAKVHVKFWFDMFEWSRTSLEGESRSGSPPGKEIYNKVGHLVDCDRHIQRP